MNYVANIVASRTVNEHGMHTNKIVTTMPANNNSGTVKIEI